MTKLLIIVFLLIEYSFSSEVLERLFKDSLEIIPEPSPITFQLSYPNYLVYFNNIRFFNPITNGMIVSSLEDSFEAKKLLLTAVCDIRIDLGKNNYYYTDFLLEFNISNYNLIKSPQTDQYEVHTLTLANLFISTSHDLVASDYFSKFTLDSKNILHWFREVLLTKFNNVIKGYYLFDDLLSILELMKNTLTKYKFNENCGSFSYTELNINSCGVISNPKPVQPELLFEGNARVDITFTKKSSVGLSQEEVLLEFKSIYDSNKKAFSLNLITKDAFIYCNKEPFLKLFLKTFKEKEEEYNKKKQEENDSNSHHLICLNPHINPFI